MPQKFDHFRNPCEINDDVQQHKKDLGYLPGWMFDGCHIYLETYEISGSNGSSQQIDHKLTETSNLRIRLACNSARFTGAKIVYDMEDQAITHVLVGPDRTRVKSLREKLSR